MEKKRSEAQELREEAEQRMARAGQREAVAELETERARRERGAAEDAISRAADVDPDLPDADEPNRSDDRGARPLRDE